LIFTQWGMFLFIMQGTKSSKRNYTGGHVKLSFIPCSAQPRQVWQSPAKNAPNDQTDPAFSNSNIESKLACIFRLHCNCVASLNATSKKNRCQSKLWSAREWSDQIKFFDGFLSGSFFCEFAWVFRKTSKNFWESKLF
jgi:hypothetical protein